MRVLLHADFLNRIYLQEMDAESLHFDHTEGKQCHEYVANKYEQ